MLMAKGGILEQNSTPEAKFHNKPLDHTSLHVVTYDGWHLSGLGTWDENMHQEKNLTIINFLIFVQKNVSTIGFQEIKIRPFGDFEKMRFLCFYIIKSMARKGYFGPKSDFRGSKIPPRGASST